MWCGAAVAGMGRSGDVSGVPARSKKIFYHFMPGQYGLEAICRKRLKMARINELNDPFEFASVIGGPELRRSSAEMKNKLHEEFGIICFSSDWHHPLMWSHYAEKHSGIALGFSIVSDADDKEMNRVKYFSKRPVNPYTEEATQSERENIIRLQLYSKAEFWKYEREYRFALGLEVPDPVTELFFHDFYGYLNLEEVIIGERCKVSTDRVFEILNTASIKAAVYKAKCSESHFIMERDQVVDIP